jgi:putative Mg2+ transporter-C (MgtC) family protein
MTNTLEWSDIALRLAFAVLTGLVIGLNRGERGKPAGLRTILLVCLAAAVSMILANAMVILSERSPQSMVRLDMMRLPLGVLTGIGFIGAGTIIKRGDMVVGVTTAATVWFVTMIGLCFGAGQYGLGIASLVLAFLVLSGLSWFEDWIRQDRRGSLTVVSAPGAAGLDEPQLRTIVMQAGCLISSCTLTFSNYVTERMIRYTVTWRARPHESRAPAFLKSLAGMQGVESVRWQAS